MASVEILAQRPSQRAEIRAAGRENALAVGVVAQRVEQVFNGEIGVPARGGLAEGYVEDGFYRGREHRSRIQQTRLRFLYRGAQRKSGLARHRGDFVSLGLGYFPG